MYNPVQDHIGVRYGRVEPHLSRFYAIQSRSQAEPSLSRLLIPERLVLALQSIRPQSFPEGDTPFTKASTELQNTFLQTQIPVQVSFLEAERLTAELLLQTPEGSATLALE